jgi:hypothetical protein
MIDLLQQKITENQTTRTHNALLLDCKFGATTTNNQWCNFMDAIGVRMLGINLMPLIAART